MYKKKIKDQFLKIITITNYLIRWNVSIGIFTPCMVEKPLGGMNLKENKIQKY